jgi:hypothetical protein
MRGNFNSFASLLFTTNKFTTYHLLKKCSTYRVLLVNLLISCLPFILNGQVLDTTYIDSDEIEDVITYGSRDSMYADIKQNILHLYGDAYVENGEIKMRAGYIMIDLKKGELLAKYREDLDSGKVEFPIFEMGEDVIEAHLVRYNFKTEKAYIEEVSIQQQENFLYMSRAKRHPNEEIHFEKGRFTTCDQAEPHYHFQLSKAVMIPEKRIVSGPMNLWIKGVPTPLGLPFSVIPQMEDKTKGLIFPEVVPLSQFGFGFNDLGFYIPVNDRLQTTFYGSLYSRGSWGLRNETDYARIYRFRGNLNLGFQQFRSGFPSTSSVDKLTVGWVHQTDRKSSPYWNFNSNVQFISDNNAKNNLDPLNATYFNNSFNSDINITRNFPGKPITMGAKISLRQNSQTQNISLASPLININVSRFFPFRKLIVGNKGIKGLLSGMGVTYTFEGQNRSLFKDTLLQQGDFAAINQTFIQGTSQRITVQTTGALFKNILKITPSINYGNRINFQQTRKSYDPLTNSTLTDTIQAPGLAHDLSFSLQATTVLYSYYKYVGKRKPLVRHVLTPSVSFSYIPNLNVELTDSVGVNKAPLTYSPFERSMYSSSSGRDQALINFGFNNTLELKRRTHRDSTNSFSKTRLIDQLSFTGSYDLLKDSMNLSDIRISLRISPVEWFNFVVTSAFSPYDWNPNSGAMLSDYAIKEGRLGRFVTNNFATTLTITSKEGRKELNQISERIPQNWNADYEFYMLHPEQLLNFNIPWKINLSHVYTLNANTSINEFNPETYLQVQTVMFSGDVSLTKRWKVSTQTNFDIKDLKITNSRLSLNRDMHCWALAFHWTPIGGNKSFLFSIRSTSALFQDAKIDLRKPPAFL